MVILLRKVITCGFGKDQLHGSTGKAFSWKYIHSSSWLAKPKKTIKYENKYPSSSETEDKITDMESQEDDKDYV